MPLQLRCGYVFDHQNTDFCFARHFHKTPPLVHAKTELETAVLCACNKCVELHGVQRDELSDGKIGRGKGGYHYRRPIIPVVRTRRSGSRRKSSKCSSSSRPPSQSPS